MHLFGIYRKFLYHRSLRISTSVCTLKTEYDRKCDFIMNFVNNLADSLLRIIERDSLSYEKLAHLCELSVRFVTKIIHRKSAPTIKTLQKMCESLNCSPNDLLLVDFDNNASYRIPMLIKDFSTTDYFGETITFVHCPRCKSVVDRDFQVFCSECGQKLNWRDF